MAKKNTDAKISNAKVKPIRKLKSLLGIVARRLMTGLSFSLPLLILLWICIVLYQLLTKVGVMIALFLLRCVNFLSSTEIDESIVRDNSLISLFTILLPLGMLVLLGIIANSTFGNRVKIALENAILQIPPLNFIYNASSQFVESFKKLSQRDKFQRVVYLNYPAEGCRLLGFVTGEYYDKDKAKNVVCVFVPTSPNPMTGFVVIVDNEKIIPSKIPIEEATKMVLSAAIVNPDNFDKQEKKT